MKMPTLEDAVRIGIEPLPEVPGCYILFVNRRLVTNLDIGITFQGNVLYIGKAETSIEQRVNRSHFLSSKSGRSTLRRSLGALLRNQLELVPHPRSTNPRDLRRFQNYKFDDAGEQRLSAWIADHIVVEAVPSATPAATENKLILALEPPLCLSKWKNPWKKQISEFRKQCRVLAEKSEGL